MAVFCAGLLFHRLGYDFYAPGQRIAQHQSQRLSYLDNGDARVRSRSESKPLWHCVEIKRLSADFTCHEDWPFRDFIVDGKSKLDAKDPQPWLYWYFNRRLTVVAQLDVEWTRDYWWTDTVRDSRRHDYVEMFYKIDPAHVGFSSIRNLSGVGVK